MSEWGEQEPSKAEKRRSWNSTKILEEQARQEKIQAEEEAQVRFYSKYYFKISQRNTFLHRKQNKGL